VTHVACMWLQRGGLHVLLVLQLGPGTHHCPAHTYMSQSTKGWPDGAFWDFFHVQPDVYTQLFFPEDIDGKSIISQMRDLPSISSGKKSGVYTSG